MELELRGKKALVLAASRGLGRAIADALAAEGVDLALCSRDAARLETAAGELRARYGVAVHARALDVRAGQALADFVAWAGQRLGGIDVLVTNAGGPPAGGFEAQADEAWQAAFELNLLSVVRAVRAALPFMRGRPNASICCVVSSSVKVPIADLVLSNSLRPAVVGLAKTLSLELAPAIRVNCVAPGRIDTERVQELDRFHAQAAGITPAEQQVRSAALIPLGRYGEPGEFASAVVFLASAAARYVTGQTWLVDGGATRVY